MSPAVWRRAGAAMSLALLGICSASCALRPSPRLGKVTLPFTTGFETDPLEAGWTPLGYGTYGRNALWSDEGPYAGQRCLAMVAAPKIGTGGWQSPPFEVDEGQHYRICFCARNPKPAYWAIWFYDRNGALCEGDHYSAVDPSDQWAAHEFYFQTKWPAATATVVFQPIGHSPLAIDTLSLAPATRQQARNWADALYATMPPVTYEPPPDAGAHLPRTLERLKGGRRLRVILVGDSIANDLSNSPLDVLLEGAFPGSRVDMQFRGRGGTGWAKHQFQVYERIAQHRPDLAVFLAISNDPEHMAAQLGRIIAETREHCPRAEFLILTPHLTAWNREEGLGIRHRDVWLAFGKEQQIEAIDLTTAWQEYLRRSGNDSTWLLRDIVHMNARGRQLAARVVLTHFVQAAARGR